MLTVAVPQSIKVWYARLPGAGLTAHGTPFLLILYLIHSVPAITSSPHYIQDAAKRNATQKARRAQLHHPPPGVSTQASATLGQRTHPFGMRMDMLLSVLSINRIQESSCGQTCPFHTMLPSSTLSLSNLRLSMCTQSALRMTVQVGRTPIPPWQMCKRMCMHV